MTDAPRADTPQPAIMQVEVTNNNDFPIEDRFNGVPVRFPIGETVTVTEAIAFHCFAWPGDAADMALHMAKRYGWTGRDHLVMNAARQPLYRQFADKVVIQPVYFDLVKRDRNDPIPADNGEDADPPPPPPEDAGETTVVGKGAKAKAKSAKSQTPVAMGGRGRGKARTSDRQAPRN